METEVPKKKQEEEEEEDKQRFPSVKADIVYVLFNRQGWVSIQYHIYVWRWLLDVYTEAGRHAISQKGDVTILRC